MCSWASLAELTKQHTQSHGRNFATAAGKAVWKEVLKDFWGPFEQLVSQTSGISITEVIDVLDPLMGAQLFQPQVLHRQRCIVHHGILLTNAYHERHSKHFQGLTEAIHGGKVSSVTLTQYLERLALRLAEPLAGGPERGGCSEVPLVRGAPGPEACQVRRLHRLQQLP